MITRPRGSKDVHELSISKEEFERKERDHEAIYSGHIRNRRPRDYSHLPPEEEHVKKVIQEVGDRDSFTCVVITGIPQEHAKYLKYNLRVWSRQLAHIYHYYLHGPQGNQKNDDQSRAPSPLQPD